MALPPPGTWFFFRKKNCKLVIKNNMHKFTPSLFLLMSVFFLSAGTPEKFSGEKSDPAIPAIFPQEDPSEKEVYLFSYFTGKNNNRNGLHFAWSEDGYRWTAIGPEHSFLKSDYGSWNRPAGSAFSIFGSAALKEPEAPDLLARKCLQSTRHYLRRIRSQLSSSHELSLDDETPA